MSSLIIGVIFIVGGLSGKLALVAAMQLDKKAREGTVRFALPQAIGRMFADGTNWTVAAPEDVVRDVLRGAARRPSITS